MTMISQIDHATASLMSRGHLILQAYRFAPTDAGHVARLAHWADLPTSASVLDVGSGTGEVARQWRRQRPDLYFTLLNLSRFQLACLGQYGDRICSDMQSMPVRSGVFSAAICCFAIGHAPLATVFREIARVVERGGIVFIYDMIGRNVRMQESLSYITHGREQIEGTARRAGLLLDVYIEPAFTDAAGREILGDDYDLYFGGLRPAMWRFIKDK